MVIIYNLLLTFIFLFSPIIFFYRIIIGKEELNRFSEKYCSYKEKKNRGCTVWFHAASVGETMSILPVLKKLEKRNEVHKILLTTTTTSSAKIFKKYNFKRTIHRYFPIDTNYISNKFIDYWEPQLAVFVESEIWPMMFQNLYKKKIPIMLLNARITKKSFKRWFIIKNFSKNIFGKIDIALPQNNESSKYLKLLGVKNIKPKGNLKFYGDKKNDINFFKKRKKFKGRKLWCAASTHFDEEIIIGKLHKRLKIKSKKILTIVIPRHIKRSNEIVSSLKDIDLKVVKHSSNTQISNDTDIYLVDTFGDTQKFYNLSSVSFVGGSLIDHGGQNPLEPARLGNFIIHGPYIQNFFEVYEYLKKIKISKIFKKTSSVENIILEKLDKKIPTLQRKKIYTVGNSILDKNLYEINKYLK